MDAKAIAASTDVADVEHQARDLLLGWAAVHANSNTDYSAMVEQLLAAGASAAAVQPFPCGNQQIDAMLRQYGAQ